MKDGINDVTSNNLSISVLLFLNSSISSLKSNSSFSSAVLMMLEDLDLIEVGVETLSDEVLLDFLLVLNYNTNYSFVTNVTNE